MKIERFEEIQAWQEARKLTKKIYDLTNQLPFRRDVKLCGQIRDASVSIMGNIAEGFDRQSKKEFIRFLDIASSSGSEVQSHLYVALDQKYISDENFQETYTQARKTKSLINGFIAYLKGKKK
ncbi:MAG: ribosomal protein [Deltaproteobacteria bacterium]|jgi:four helix bundle protein|nr:ribosomal protein [Deltaproteobacteria bacterium]